MNFVGLCLIVEFTGKRLHLDLQCAQDTISGEFCGDIKSGDNQYTGPLVVNALPKQGDK